MNYELSLMTIDSIIASILILLLIVGLTYYCFYLLTDHDAYKVKKHRKYNMPDELACAIVSLIDDHYAPIFGVDLKDHLCSDLYIDSLDIADLLFDVSQIIGVPLNAAQFYDKYGRNPTVAQLIAYAHYAMDNPTPHS